MISQTGSIIAFVVGLSTASAPAQVQPGASQVPAQATEPCELHVWPAPDYITDIHGLFPAGSAVGALEMPNTRRQLNPDGRGVIETWLSPEFIGETIRSANLSTILNRPVTVILHLTTRREASRILRARTRSTASTASCYYELHVRTVFLQRSVMLGTRFFTAWRLKSFTAEGRPPRVRTGSKIHRLRGFSVDRPVDEIRADIENALRRSFDTFIRGALTEPTS
ncbi:MAG: hypothetical protein M3177_08105 [Pseudomonadota bacterium]|nr:hypothetical protein [Pseudomonadota bacterium]